MPPVWRPLVGLVERFICWNPTIERFQGTSEDSDSMLDDFAWCWMFFAIMLDNFWTSSDKLWTMLDHFRLLWIGTGLGIWHCLWQNWNIHQAWSVSYDNLDHFGPMRYLRSQRERVTNPDPERSVSTLVLLQHYPIISRMISEKKNRLRRNFSAAKLSIPQIFSVWARFSAPSLGFRQMTAETTPSNGRKSSLRL